MTYHYEIARHWRPTFLQGYAGQWDKIVPIYLEEWYDDVYPVVYYSVTEDSEFHYVLYCVFHYRDWTQAPPPIKQLDSHKYDFEGTLRIIRRPMQPEWLVTVFHHNLRFYRTNLGQVNIQARGHGQYVHWRPPGPKYLRYAPYSYGLRDINEPKTQKWLRETVQPAFNANDVKMPWQWNDARIRQRYGAESDGLIYRDPQQLLRYARSVNAQFLSNNDFWVEEVME